VAGAACAAQEAGRGARRVRPQVAAGAPAGGSGCGSGEGAAARHGAG